MQVINNLKEEFHLRWNIIKNKNIEKERKIFAGLELFCFPVSFITIFIFLPLQIIAGNMGWNWYTPFAPFINILLSAAIGYITNYIAIEMLFKPYYEKKSHPLSIITFGYWKQGLIPRNKNHIGKELGHQIETKLLNPENMANELCDMVMGFIQDPKIIEKLRNAIQNMLHNHEKSILDFLTPQIENSLQTALDKILTKENINNFWKDEIEPLLMHEEHRNFIALQIRKSLQNRTPQLTKILKEELKKISFEYLSQKLPLGIGAQTISNGLTEFINWDNIQLRLKEKLEAEDTLNMLQDELQNLITQIKIWMNDSDNLEKIESFINNIKTTLRSSIHNYLSEELPSIANEIINSEQLWDWCQNNLIPSMKIQLEQLIKGEGKDKVIEKLDLAARVAASVEKQEVKEFHDMINSIAAQHLGAIQVLGYFLGLLIGMLQLFS